MMFAKRLALGAVVLGLSLSTVNAQNGENFFALANVGEAIAGTNSVNDGIGTWIMGEELKGSQLLNDPFLGPGFHYRFNGWRFFQCTANSLMSWPGLFWVELDGLDGNNPPIFLRPDSACAAGITPSFIPYGAAFTPSGGFSLLLAGLPSGVYAALTGFPTTAGILLPNHDLFQSGTATIVAIGGGLAALPGGSGCYGIQFGFAGGTNLPITDDVDGLWYYTAHTSTNNGQYLFYSIDETNAWQSNSVGIFGGLPAAFFANTDFELYLVQPEPSTMAMLAPVGELGNGVYYTTTEGLGAFNLNGGFEVGRGSHTLSLSGTGGATNPGTGLSNQDPSYNTSIAAQPTIGFMTWDNNQAAARNHFTWVGADLAQLFAVSPEADPNIVVNAGTVKVPQVGTGFIQSLTLNLLPLFLHSTVDVGTWTQPDGFPDGTFGNNMWAGGSNQYPTTGVTTGLPCGVGIAINLTYGSSQRGTSPQIVWNQFVSGSREVYLMD